MAEYAKRFIAKKEINGSIVNISTDGANSPYPGKVSYGASKLAIESYSRSAAHEFGKYGIRVNIIGPVQTGWIDENFEKKMKSMIPLNRIGMPEEIADAVVFMASRQARWITGQRRDYGSMVVLGCSSTKGEKNLAQFYYFVFCVFSENS
jgi:3-oxoacyl-[acyl-carrier protein] reductase